MNKFDYEALFTKVLLLMEFRKIGRYLQSLCHESATGEPDSEFRFAKFRTINPDPPLLELRLLISESLESGSAQTLNCRLQIQNFESGPANWASRIQNSDSAPFRPQNSEVQI